MNSDAFLPFKDKLELTYDGKRLKWNKTLEDLKHFFVNVVGLNGKWTSPGGKAKKLSNCRSNITVTWYYGKQRTLLFQGKQGYLLKDFLIKVCEGNSRSSPGQVNLNDGVCADEIISYP